MLFHSLLMALVVSSSAAEGDRPHTLSPAIGHHPDEPKLSQLATGHRRRAFRGTVLAALPAEPAGGNPSVPGNAAPRDPGDTGSTTGGNQFFWRIGTQLLFGLMYYLLIVKNYPELKDTEPTTLAVDLQKQNEVLALGKVSGPNCILSLCCSGPRAAHTFHSVGELSYWPGLFLMSLLPCCTLWFMNCRSDLNEKIGGQRRGFCMSCLCACCCSCCVIAQDAEALDLTMGVQTGLCGVYENVV
mmetsp:Transcript_13811/g.26697  ORF Transcript_13811/g.26697 Transcript_13811/m.26697 type:complete len:243 (+) Transcript_13811:30-758(+)